MENKTPAARQLPLDFEPWPARYGRDDFLISQSNRAAVSMADTFLASREPTLLILGPLASGKTHLAHILARQAETSIVQAAGGALESLPTTRMVVIDGAEECPDPSALLLLVERLRQNGAKLALAGRGEPRAWARGLADLETRLGAMARALLEEPDEALMRAVMRKALSERGLRVPDSVIIYAAPRLPRTFAAARRFIDLAEREMKESAASINIALARKVLSNLSEAPPAA